MWSKGWWLLGWKSRGVCKRKKWENRRLVSYFCKGKKKKPPLFPRGEVIPPRGPVKKAARCSGLSLTSSKAATQSFAHPSCSGTGERIESVKARKLVGCDKASWISEGRKKKKEKNQSLTTSHQQTDARPVSEQWLPWKDQTLHTYCWVTQHWLSFWPIQISCPACVPSPPLATSSFILHGQDEKHCLAIAETSVLSTLFQSQIQSIAPYR